MVVVGILALGELVVIAALGYLLYRSGERSGERSAELEQMHRAERYELQERIRRPEAMPGKHRPPRRQPDEDDSKERAEYAKVGTAAPFAGDPDPEPDA